MEIMYDVVFDQEFAGGLQMNCSPGRGYRVPKPALINISHGMRLVQQKTVNPGMFLFNYLHRFHSSMLQDYMNN